MILEINHEKAVAKVEKIATYIVKRRMASPAILAIESLRPLNFIGSQLLYFLAPFAEIIFNDREYEEFAALIEKDEYVKLLLRRIEEIDVEMYREERNERKLMRLRRKNKIKNFFKKIRPKRRKV